MCWKLLTENEATSEDLWQPLHSLSYWGAWHSDDEDFTQSLILSDLYMFSRRCEMQQNLRWRSHPPQHSRRKILRASLTIRSRHVGGRGRPKDDSTEGEKTQSFACIIRCEAVWFRLQKNRNGRQLWVVNVFSYTIHAQNVDHRAALLLFPYFFPLTVTFPKLSVILRPLYRATGAPAPTLIRVWC
jgi:hypothetical protein